MSALDMAGAIMRVVICSILLLLSVGSTVTQGFETVGGPPRQIHRAHPLAQGLVGWWLVVPPLVGSKTFYNLVVPQHSTLLGMGTGFGFTPTSRAGGWGELKFDGSNAYALGATNTTYDFLDQTFTVSFWYRTTGAGYLVNKRHVAGSGGGWFIRADAGGTLTVRVMEAAASNPCAQRSTVSTTHLDGTWRQATVLLKTDTVGPEGLGCDVTLYINGILDQGTNTQTAFGPHGPCTCGLAFGAQADAEAGTFLPGSLDDIRIWNRGLGLQEIQAVATQSAPSFGGLLMPVELSPVALVTTVTPTGTLLPFFK